MKLSAFYCDTISMHGLVLILTLVTPIERVQSCDVWRFPFTTSEAKHGWHVSKTHAEWLWEHRGWDAAWLADAKWRARCWDLLDDVRRIHPHDLEACRRKLTELRLLLGDEAYRLGVMPDYLPAWRFTERPNE